MLRNLLLTLGIVLTTSLIVYPQSGALKGKITDKLTKEPIPFANLVIEVGGTQIGGSTSDFDGNYTIKPIPPGKYDLKATFVGYKPILVKGIIIVADQIRFYNIEMESTVETLEEFEVIDYKVPLISKDQTTSGETVTAEEIAKMPNRSANAVAATVGGVFSRDGERGNVRGARADGTVMYIDGIRVRGSSALPPSAIEQVSVMLGGVPAQYGDAVGGIINVTTKGPSRKFGAGIELETSEFLDKFGYSRVGLNLNGPLFTRKNEDGSVKSSLFGYFIAADVTYRKDGRPSAIGIYKGKDDIIQYLEDNPLRPSGLPSGGTFLNGEYLRTDDLEHVNMTQNTANTSVNISGKIDVKTTRTINLTFGGQYVYNHWRGFNYRSSLLNYDKNSLNTNYTWRVFGRFTQRFPTDRDSKSLIKNVYYTIQADYSKFYQETQDADHKDDLFKYGYLGKYTTHKMPTFQLGADTIHGQPYQNVWLLNSWDYDTLVEFDPFDCNPLVANYTSSYYDLYAGQPVGNYQNFDQIQLGGGLLNGQGPPRIYGLYNTPGTLQAGYGVTDLTQFSVNAAGAADIGNHEFKFGLQYEQRIDRGYGYAPQGFWTLMRGLTNFHILELDVENPIPVYVDGVFQDMIIYNRKYDELSQRVFDINLRKKLGLPVDGLDFITIDSYDINNYSINYYDQYGILRTIQLDEDIFTVDMFSPDELLNNGNSYVFCRGYDYTGKKLKSKPSFEDFFNKKDENGVYTREIGAFEPIYMAGYIQDKFAFRDLIFNIGVRVDRYDANQKVLADPFLLFPAKTVGEVSSDEFGPHPSNMGNDYIVYVDNVDNPTRVVGYREGDVWYSADGVEITDPGILDAGSGISPYLIDPSLDRVTIDAFEDYEPQINVMPRISFSFPISDEALFFAHYDVLTQRPTSGNIASPATYWFFQNIGDVISNPNLKPTKTIDYELGFQQKLTNTSSLTITTYYREVRDQIAIYRYYGAYPKDYTSFSNLDFGTTKGLTIEYDLRRTKNARIRASYTLQFADATGASPTTAAALVASGQPNLRTTNPLPWDRRHAINLVLDYRFTGGKDYDGPVINRKNKGGDKAKSPILLLQNTGFNMTFNGGSGTPYTASRNIISLISGGNRLLKGTYFGSRLPWQFRMDLRIDKDIFFNLGKNKKQAYMNVYFQILNVLNTKNVIGVYPATGNPNDDGYLAAAEYQSEIEMQQDPQSFRELYTIYEDYPYNYSSPRRIRFGVIFNF
ncbi:MAG: carboxypeptidase-like regulatory domain-containing protein [Bacteroidetes bacterium]|nr:carboxypeptidase-like regulatory domain-containing protein [Bacteroidota bacterium]